MLPRLRTIAVLTFAGFILAIAAIAWRIDGPARYAWATAADLPYRAAIPNLACDGCPAGNLTPTPTATPAVRNITVTGNGQTANLTVELALTAAEHARGLMFRESLAEDAGMLFIFAHPGTGAFWMKNTLIPLDIAYLDADGRVLQIVHGQPLDETPLPPNQLYRYTLEVNGGWFESHDMGVGATVSIPPDLVPGS